MMYDMWNGPPHPGWPDLLMAISQDLLEMGEPTPQGIPVRPSPNIPRLRDVYPVLVDGVWEIHLLTRSGAEEDNTEGNAMLRSVPGYIADETWSFDSTYRTFRYSADQEMFNGMTEEHSWPPIQERWDAFMSKDDSEE